MRSRLSMLQFLSGTLIVLSAVLFSVFVEPGYWRDQGVDGELMLMVFGNPGSNTAVESWVLSYTGLGLAVLATGIASFFIKTSIASVRLAAGQTLLGVLVVFSLIVFMLWIEPGWAPYTRLSDYTGNQVLMSHDPGWVATQLVWKAASLLVGLIVAGLGAMQLLRHTKPVLTGREVQPRVVSHG